MHAPGAGQPELSGQLAAEPPATSGGLIELAGNRPAGARYLSRSLLCLAFRAVACGRGCADALSLNCPAQGARVPPSVADRLGRMDALFANAVGKPEPFSDGNLGFLCSIAHGRSLTERCLVARVIVAGVAEHATQHVNRADGAGGSRLAEMCPQARRCCDDFHANSVC